jgi:hypothetical protein
MDKPRPPSQHIIAWLRLAAPASIVALLPHMQGENLRFDGLFRAKDIDILNGIACTDLAHEGAADDDFVDERALFELIGSGSADDPAM